MLKMRLLDAIKFPYFGLFQISKKTLWFLDFEIYLGMDTVRKIQEFKRSRQQTSLLRQACSLHCRNYIKMGRHIPDTTIPQVSSFEIVWSFEIAYNAFCTLISMFLKLFLFFKLIGLHAAVYLLLHSRQVILSNQE